MLGIGLSLSYWVSGEGLGELLIDHKKSICYTFKNARDGRLSGRCNIFMEDHDAGQSPVAIPYIINNANKVRFFSVPGNISRFTFPIACCTECLVYIPFGRIGVSVANQLLVGLAEREVGRMRTTRRSGPSAENMLRDLGVTASGIG